MATAEAPTGAAPSGDPYAAAKANLRDTVKWLASALAAIGAAVLAGTSFADLSGLTTERLAIALVGGAAGLACVLSAIGVLLSLLTAESVFLSDLETNVRLREMLNRHAADFLPVEYPTLREFLEARDGAAGTLRNRNASDQAYGEAKQLFDVAEIVKLRLMQWAQFEDMRTRLKAKGGLLLGLSVGAVLGIGVLAVMAGTAKSLSSDRASKGPILQLSPGKSWSDVAQALTDACGDAGPLKAQLLGQPQSGWVELRLLAPPSCAGINLSLPTKVIAAPSAKP